MREKCNVLSIIILGIILSLFIVCSSVSMPKLPPIPTRPQLKEGKNVEDYEYNIKELIKYSSELESYIESVKNTK